MRNKLGQFVAQPVVLRSCLYCGNEFIISGSGRAKRIKTAKFCSTKCRYSNGHSEETKEKTRRSLLGERNHFYGKKHSEETKKLLSDISINKGKRGSKANNWRGGITPIRYILRNSIEYEEWRKKCLERDLYICQDCGELGGYLHVDHIKSFSDFPELRFEITNGRTLCRPCHFLRTWGKTMPKKSKWAYKIRRNK